MAGSDLTGDKALQEAPQGEPGGPPGLERLCIESAPYGVLVHDDAGRILLYNRQLELISGYGRGEIRDLAAWIETVYPDPAYRSLVIRERRDAASADGVRTREAMITRKDGCLRMCRFTSSRPCPGLRVVFVRDIHAAPEAGANGPAAAGAAGRGPAALLSWVRRGDGFFLCGFNAAAEEWSGGALAERLTAEVGELFPGREDLRADMQRCLDRRVGLRRKMLFPFAAGGGDAYVDAAYTFSPPVFVSLQLEDLSELMRAEQKLAQSERKFIEFADMLPEIVFETDTRGRLRYLNRSGLEQVGLTAEDLQQGVAAEDFMHPGDRGRGEANFRRVIAGADLGLNEYTLVRRDGSSFPVLLRSKLLVENGAAVGTRGFIIDVSARKQAEDELRASEEKFSKAFQASSNGCAITTFEEGRWLDCNASECRMTGYRREELIGCTTAELNYYVDPGMRERLLRLLEDEGFVRNVEFRFRRKSGEIRTGLFSAAVITLGGRRCILGEVLDCTEQKAAEQALKLSEERLHLAVEAARIGIHSTDLETGTIHWSQELCDIMGMPAGAVTTSQEGWKVVHPDDLDRVMDVQRRALDPAGDGLFQSEHRVVRPDGEVRWISWQGRTYFRDTPAGRVPVRRIGACIDITRRKEAEIALQRSESKFSEMFHVSPHGLALTTFDEARYLEANPAESTLTGYSRGELIGRSAFETGFYVDPEEGHKIRQLLTREGKFTNYKLRFRRKSGEIRWGLASTSLIDFDGKKCLLSCVSDITDLRNAEEALKLSEERLRMATEGATIAWWDWDIRSGSSACNDIYYTMLGYAPQEFPVSYERWQELVFPDDQVAALDRFRQVLAGNLPTFKAEYRIRCKDGSWRWVLGIGRVFERDEDGKAARAIGVHIDIHERKVFEEELYRANRDLEERVRARTAALEELNESLRREISARGAAEEELRARTEELAEINNALRVILRKSREESEENARKMATCIRQLAFPYLEKLKLCRLPGRPAAFVKLLEEALEEIASPAAATLSELHQRLTPSELQVAALVRQGRTSKEIAEILSLSFRTIESHRKKIRRKLGLQHSKANLRSCLMDTGKTIAEAQKFFENEASGTLQGKSST